MFLSAEKRKDALPDRSHHQLPGSLHLHGGSAGRLLPLLVSEVNVGLAAANNPRDIRDLTGASHPSFKAPHSHSKAVWSWDGRLPISIPQT